MVNVVSLLSSPVAAPGGLWAIILNWIEKGIVNYGWVIILFTLLVKVCLSPLDFLMKFSTKKQTLVQQKLAPQIARINLKYQNDKNAAQIQTNALYKKEGYNVFLSCLVMIINLAITMTVFLTLFSSLREMSAYKAINQYDAIQTAYIQTYNDNIDSAKTEFKNKFAINGEFYNATFYAVNTEDNTEEVLASSLNLNNIVDYFYFVSPTSGDTFKFDEDDAINTEIETEVKKALNLYVNEQKTKKLVNVLVECGEPVNELASISAQSKWSEVKENWLWIENIWVADNYKTPLPTYDDLTNLAKSSKVKEYQNHVASINKDLHIQVTSSVQTKINRWNGFFILAILAGVTSFLTQFVSDLMNKTKNKNVNKLVENANPNTGTMKFMKLLMPALMIIFVLTSSAAFGIYIVVNSLISIGISALTSLIVNACYKKKQAEILEYLEKEANKSARRSKRKI